MNFHNIMIMQHRWLQNSKNRHVYQLSATVVQSGNTQGGLLRIKQIKLVHSVVGEDHMQEVAFETVFESWVWLKAFYVPGMQYLGVEMAELTLQEGQLEDIGHCRLGLGLWVHLVLASSYWYFLQLLSYHTVNNLAMLLTSNAPPTRDRDLWSHE